MNNEIDRIKNDVETIQRTLGLPSAAGRDWIHWMQSDCWFNLWWCLPGAIIVIAALLPVDPHARYFGLMLNQWAAIPIIASLLGIAVAAGRRTKGRDGRPEAMVREQVRMGRAAWIFSMGLFAQVLLYFLWGWRSNVPFAAFWSGLFLMIGSTFLIGALVARTWEPRVHGALGFAIPFTAYGLCVLLIPHAVVPHAKVNGVLFGLMFIAIGLCLTFIEAARIRRAKSDHEAH